MLNICIVFALPERETIQKRVTDAYYSRCLKGFHMSGQSPYGFRLEPTMVEGIRTKMMVPAPAAADFAGTNGCYLYQGRDVKEDKGNSPFQCARRTDQLAEIRLALPYDIHKKQGRARPPISLPF